MNTPASPIVCAHPDEEKTARACEHLLKKTNSEYYSTSSDHSRFFTGQSFEFVLLCPDCAKNPDGSKTHWRTICYWCMQDIACGTRVGELGAPEIRSRESELTLKHRSIEVPVKNIVAASPMGNRADGFWVLLTADGELMILNPAKQSVERVELPTPINPSGDQPMSLTVSDDGRFAAVVNTYGRSGIVVDLEQRRVAMELMRGNYYNEHSKFPVAFVKHGGKQLLIHATDWNRLDVSDPLTGQLLTPREPTAYRESENRPPHFLDYFQCGLAVSPDGQWIAGNGWRWHPVGIVTAWNITRWLTENVWESEDGPSNVSLCWRNYYWDGPLCWIDGHTLAVWGLGDDDIVMVPGVRLFDVRTGQETFSFAGPVGGSRKTTLREDGKEQAFILSDGHLVFDRWLFSWMEGKSFSVWDVTDGGRLLEKPDFAPVGYHRGTKEFLSILPNGTMRLTLVRDYGDTTRLSFTLPK